MTTNDLLNLDCRNAENLKALKRALTKIDPLKDIEDIQFEKLEKLINLFKKKYVVSIPMILSCSKDGYYTMSIEAKGNKTRLVYGITMYETFAKASILLWTMLKKGNLRKR